MQKFLAEAQDLALHSGQAAGPNVMYFETGQGSELSSEANFWRRPSHNGSALLWLSQKI